MSPLQSHQHLSLAAAITFPEALNIRESPYAVFLRFQKPDSGRCFPIVDDDSKPLGIIRDSAFKPYAFSNFGRELLIKASRTEHLDSFVEKVPVLPLECTQSQLLEAFACNPDIEGIILHRQQCYHGFISAWSLLQLLHQEDLRKALDHNPLTHLPGNRVIESYLSTCGQFSGVRTLAYFDFDHFKPFNDRYGFRRGDQAILRFSEILLEHTGNNDLCAHIGGDDFFFGIDSLSPEEALANIRAVQHQFSRQAAKLYDSEDIAQQGIVSMDRNGNLQLFPLLRVSTSVVLLRCPSHQSVQDITSLLAEGKKKAKQSSEGIWVVDSESTLSPSWIHPIMTLEKNHDQASLSIPGPNDGTSSKYAARNS